MSKFKLIIAGLFLVATLPVHAGPDGGDASKFFQETRKSANQGNVNAQALLGNMYENGIGVKADDVLALKWYRRAAEQGDADAEASVGLYYAKGQGGAPQDYAQAAEWYRKAAEQGSSDAQWFLGSLYGQGKGVPQDYVLAYKWIALSAANADSSMVDGIVGIRDDLAAQMTKAQIAEAQRLAREWAEAHPKTKR